MNNDIISREALKEALNYVYYCPYIESKSKEGIVSDIINTIDNAPTVEINTNAIEYKAYCKGLEDGKKIARPQGEWISKEEALKILCEKCPVYNCVSGCNSYRSIEKMSSVQSQRPTGDLANEVWKLYENHQSHLATRVLEFGDELKELLGKYQKGGAK